MSATNPVNLNISAAALFMLCHMTQCIVLTDKCFHLRSSKGSSVHSLTSYKSIAITFHRNHKLNIRNHQNATYLSPGIKEYNKQLQTVIPWVITHCYTLLLFTLSAHSFTVTKRLLLCESNKSRWTDWHFYKMHHSNVNCWKN